MNVSSRSIRKPERFSSKNLSIGTHLMGGLFGGLLCMQRMRVDIMVLWDTPM